ncbi:MAG: hypothetical protein PHF46_01060 [Candidatus Gracilibacteria bacterium]|nr:hypothetical protein [Candidatus Gracilibacteria bacterium]
MTENTIGVRELHYNFKEISDKVIKNQEEFLVIRNSKPIFKIVPIKKTVKKKYILQDFSKLEFAGGKDLSQDIDNLMYR